MIIVDSGCDYCDDLNGVVERVPLTLSVGGQGFMDDENLDIDSYIEVMEGSPSAVKTAAPSPAAFMEKFKKDGAAFVVTLSSKLSASYNNAVLAKELYLEEARDKVIHVFDSLSATCGQTLIAIKIKELLGKGAAESEVASKVTSFVENLKTYFVLEKYDNLVKGGRMSPLLAKVAGFLNIKPVCEGKKGEIAMIDKCMGTKRALSRLAEIIAETVEGENIDFSGRVFAVSHVKCLGRAKSFVDDVMRRVKFKDAMIMDMSGITATYAERGGITAAF